MSESIHEARTLSAKQEDILRGLLGHGADRPDFDADLALTLRGQLEAGLGDVAKAVPDGERLVIAKYPLQQVLQCEGRYRASLEKPFAWDLHNVRGRIAHKAIERQIISGGDRSPLDLSKSAFQRLAETEDPWDPGGFLRTVGDEDRHDLIREVNDIVTKFVIDWPPIQRSWMPRVESSVKYPLFDGRVELNSKVDLALGRPEGRQARALIVDFKTGRPGPEHWDDLRFYALTETLARGTPPFRVATYYLDSGTWLAEDVTVELLGFAVERVVAGAALMARVRMSPQSAELRAGPLCPWCPAYSNCPTGQNAQPVGAGAGESF